MKYLIIAGVLIGLAALLNSCVGDAIKKPTRTFEEEVLLKHNLRDNDYEFFFNQKNQEWKIYQGNHPKAIDWSKPVAVVEGDYIQLPGLDNSIRTYFGVVSEQDTFILSERRIALDGASNFRDLGGIRTEEGRYVKWGKIFRANRLSDLSKTDLRTLNYLGLKIVADFRYEVESRKHPDKVPTGAKYFQYPIGDKEGTRYLEMKTKVRQGATAPEVKDMFIGIMEEFADTGTVFFQPVIDHLLAEEVPLVFHCSGGKDRTGYMSAMILSALGVDRETIMNEYLMSNYYRYQDNRSNYRKGRLVGIDKEVLATGFLVKEAYMNKVWEVIDEKYGDTNQYLEEKYSLTAKKREKLKEMYTYGVEELVPSIAAKIE
ncbi:MAG: tyrosine-protein phosphatase [Bacteroidota bacterium]